MGKKSAADLYKWGGKNRAGVWEFNYNGNDVHVYRALPSRPDRRTDFALGSPSVDYSTLKGMNHV